MSDYFPAKKTTRKPLQKYNPGVLGEDNLENLKIGVLEELWDISKNFVQTDELLGDTYEKVERVEIEVDNAKGYIEEVWYLSVEADKILAAKIEHLGAEMESGDKTLSAMVSEEMYARVTADDALAAKIDEVKAEIEGENGVISSQIKDIILAYVAADEALALSIRELKAEIESPDSVLNATIREEQVARVKGDEALAKSIKELSTSMETEDFRLGSLITETNNTVTNLEQTVAENKLELESKIDNSTNDAVDEAVAQAQKELNAAKKALEAAIASGDSAAAADLIKEINRLTNIINANKADIESKLSVTNQTVSNLQSTTASQITNLQSSFNGQISTVNQTLKTHADKLGNLSASWGVTVDANGTIGGIELVTDSNTKKSEFKVRADRFSFTDANGGKSGGFSSSGGVTTFSGAINVADQGGNVGMKITNSQILIYDTSGRLRVRLGKLT